jgi:hypothetical protein
MANFTGIGSKQTNELDEQTEKLNLFERITVSPDKVLGHHKERIFPNSDTALTSPNAPIVFDIKNLSQHYLDLSTTRLEGAFRIKKIGGGNLSDTDIVTFANSIHSMIERVEILVNGVLITDFTTNRYGYKAHIENMLSYNNMAMHHLSALSHWHLDDADRYDNMNIKDMTIDGKTINPNTGFVKRYNKTKESKLVPFSIPLYSDVFQADKVWPSNINFTVRITKAPPEFFLMAPKKTDGTYPAYKIEYDELYLEITKLSIHPVLLRFNEQKLLKTNFRYHFDKVQIAEHGLKQNQPNMQIEVYSGVLPKYAISFFARGSAASGVYDENPYLFENCNLLESYAKVNGVILDTYPLKTDYENDRFLGAYKKLFDTMTIKRGNNQHFVSPELFKNSCCLQVYDFTADASFGVSVTEPVEGTITYHYTFKNPGLQSSYTLYSYLVFHDFYELDAERHVIVSTGRPI